MNINMDIDIDMNEIKKNFEEKGYVVIPNIITNEEIIEYINEFNKWMDSIPNSDYLHSIIHYHGIFKYFQVGHQRFAWLMRTNEKIINVFKALWDTDELVVSFDGCCYYPSNSNNLSSYWIHSDQSPLKKNLCCIQSFISLTSNKEKTFLVYEGSHKLHEHHTNTYNIQSNSDWYPINQDYVKNIEHTKKILHVEAGSLVLWDSRTFHQNTCANPNSKEERLVQYLCYLPKNNKNNTTEMTEFRMACFNNLRTTNHYPYPISCVPLQPNAYNYYNHENINIDYSKIKKPYLNDLLDKIYKLL